MSKTSISAIILALTFGACSFLLVSDAVAQERIPLTPPPDARKTWNQPVEPFRVIGNIYYVGTNELTQFLITTPRGHILLDAGWPESAPMIEANVKKLGYRVEDIKWLLNSHAHADHMGGFAAMKKATGAKLAVSEPDAETVRRGIPGNSPPVEVDRVLQDGDTVELGGVVLTAHLTPGHTRGCTTWTMVVQDGGKKYNVVFLGSLHANPATFQRTKSVETVVADFDRAFATARKLPCDVFLGAHGFFFDLEQKRKRLEQQPNPFIDPKGYQEVINEEEQNFRRMLAEQTAK